MTTRPIPIRLEDETLRRLDRIAAKLSERAMGAKVTRAAALRRVIVLGVDRVENELGLPPGLFDEHQRNRDAELAAVEAEVNAAKAGVKSRRPARRPK